MTKNKFVEIYKEFGCSSSGYERSCIKYKLTPYFNSFEGVKGKQCEFSCKGLIKQHPNFYKFFFSPLLEPDFPRDLAVKNLYNIFPDLIDKDIYFNTFLINLMLNYFYDKNKQYEFDFT